MGNPGAGKTIALLQLAQRLIERTEENLTQPIPIVLNLSSWAKRRSSIEEWLTEELREKYQVPKVMAQAWIQQEQLILLLDGLDEVKVEHQNACVRALNQFISGHGLTEIIVCSRVKDYETLSERLQLSSAVCIQPLSKERLYQFLDESGDSLAGLRAILQQDTDLEQFAQTPLILNIMNAVYRGQSAEALLKQTGSTDDRYRRLFDAYIERMLERRSIASKYSQGEVRRWLSCLAKRMVQESQTIFLIEKMNLSWLQHPDERIAYLSRNNLISGLIASLSFWLIVGLSFWLIAGLSFWLIVGLSFWLFFSFFFILVAGLKSERGALVDQLNWSFKNIQTAKQKLVQGNQQKEQILSRSSILTASRPMVSMLGFIGYEVEQRAVPNQGIWSSARNGLIVGLFFGLSTGMVSGAILGLIFGWISGLIFGCVIGLCNCFMWSLSYGSAACIQHLSLRLVLYQEGYVPWNYARFLDYTSERLLMKKVGGGYVFFHRMLMEHFAQMNQE